MNESWKTHIQPILNSMQRDHFTWIWEPFLKKYPKFNDEQRIQVENALAFTAFDLSDEKLAIKALSIAQTLYINHLSTSRLSELIKNGLREQVQTLKFISVVTYV